MVPPLLATLQKVLSAAADAAAAASMQFTLSLSLSLSLSPSLAPKLKRIDSKCRCCRRASKLCADAAAALARGGQGHGGFEQGTCFEWCDT